MIFDPEAARFGQLVQCAMDMHVGDRANLTPAPDSRLAPDWKVIGYLVAVDCLFRRGQTVALGEPTCYGFLAQSTADPTKHVAVIRGTEGILEWITDGMFVSIPHPVAGRVEFGFFSLYGRMKYLGVAQAAAGMTLTAAPPLAVGIAAAIGQGSVTVIGHSLGSPLAIFTTFDLVPLIGDRAAGCYFASPRPGNAAFAQAFDARVKSYRLFNYEMDAVPRVPRGPDYTDLPRVSWIGINDAQAHIRFELPCHHHIDSYCAMLDFNLLNWGAVPALDLECARCITGPSSAFLSQGNYP